VKEKEKCGLDGVCWWKKENLMRLGGVRSVINEWRVGYE